MKMARITLGLAAVWVSMLGLPASADLTDPLIEGAKLCTRHLPRFEREYGIPTHLLAAIASTESGRYHSGLKIRVPWPWTINADGKGYYFDSKQEAISAAKRLRAYGVKSMDVGCMQVNLMHHGDAFSSLEQAFEPQYNVAYAASFLRGLFESEKSWKQAAASYHSKTPSRGSQYVAQVYDSWYQIIDKLRAARLQTGAAPVEVASSEAPAKPIQLASLSKEAADKPYGAKVVAVSTRQSPRMNSVRLSGKTYSKENGVIIVRPKIKVVQEPAALTTLASAAPEEKPAAVNAVAQAPKRAEPNFVFEN